MIRGAETETSTGAQLSAPVGVRTRAWKVKTKSPKSPKSEEFQNSNVIYREHLRNKCLTFGAVPATWEKEFLSNVNTQLQTSALGFELRRNCET